MLLVMVMCLMVGCSMDPDRLPHRGMGDDSMMMAGFGGASRIASYQRRVEGKNRQSDDVLEWES